MFLVAFGLRLLHLFQIRHSPFFTVLMGDARGYDEWAQRIAGGDWIGQEVFYQAPLYPYFLGTLYAVLGRDLMAVRVVQALIGSASCVLLALAAARLFSWRAGLFAGLALAIYAPAIFFDGLIQKSVLDVLLVCGAIWLLTGVRGPQRTQKITWAAAGLVMGLLSLTRENALLLVAVVAVWAAWEGGRPEVGAAQTLEAATALPRRTKRSSARVADVGPSLAARLAPAALFLAGVALVLAPVAIRNNAVGGGFFITTSQFGPNFYIGNNPRADGTYASLRFGRGSPEYERLDATQLAEVATGRSLTPAEVSSYWTDRALAFIADQPFAWLKLIGRKTLLLVNGDEMLDTESQESYAEYSLPLRLTGPFTHYGILVPLAAFGTWVAWPHRRRLALFYALTFAYAASVILFYVFARYRYPLTPFLMLFAAYGGAHLIAIRGHADPRRAFGLALAVGLAIPANWPLLSSDLMKAITENNLAAALHQDGRLDEAIAHYERSIALRPDYAPAHNNLGVALRAQGRTGDAVRSYQQALAVESDYPDAHYNLANVLLEQRKPAEAAAHLRSALRVIPGTARAHNNLAIALAAEGRMDDAIAEFQKALAADPNAAMIHRNLGSALVDRGRVDEGVRHLQRATILDPKDASAHYDLGSVYLAAAQFADAVVEFRWTLEIDPKMPQAHNNLGIALASQGYIEEAIEHFREAIRLDPKYEDPRRNLDTALRGAAR